MRSTYFCASWRELKSPTCVTQRGERNVVRVGREFRKLLLTNLSHLNRFRLVSFPELPPCSNTDAESLGFVTCVTIAFGCSFLLLFGRMRHFCRFMRSRFHLFRMQRYALLTACSISAEWLRITVPCPASDWRSFSVSVDCACAELANRKGARSKSESFMMRYQIVSL